MKMLTVNEALNPLVCPLGGCVTVTGILTFDFEDISLNHWAIAERKEKSSIWISVSDGAFRFNEEILEKWSGKRVVVMGEVIRSEEGSVDKLTFGFGHLGLWDAEMIALRIDLYKRYVREHGG